MQAPARVKGNPHCPTVTGETWSTGNKRAVGDGRSAPLSEGVGWCAMDGCTRIYENELTGDMSPAWEGLETHIMCDRKTCSDRSDN